MASTTKKPPTKKPAAKGGGSFLTKDVGPLPVWGWAAAGLVVALVWRGSSKSKTKAADGTTPDTTAAGQDFGGGYDAGFRAALGAVGGGGVAPGGGAGSSTLGGGSSTTVANSAPGATSTTVDNDPSPNILGSNPAQPRIKSLDQAPPKTGDQLPVPIFLAPAPPAQLAPPVFAPTPADQAPAYATPPQLVPDFTAHVIANPVPGDASSVVAGTVDSHPFTYGGSPDEAANLISQSDQAALVSYYSGLFGGNDPAVNPMVSPAPPVITQAGQAIPAPPGVGQRYVDPAGHTFTAG